MGSMYLPVLTILWYKVVYMCISQCKKAVTFCNFLPLCLNKAIIYELMPIPFMCCSEPKFYDKLPFTVQFFRDNKIILMLPAHFHDVIYDHIW